MQLTEFISSDVVVPDLKVTAKADAIKQLTHLLFQAKNLKGVEAAIDQIMARETTESTGIGHGIAVPHARVPGLKSLICAVARVPKGLDFLAVDRKPVSLIFLICYPPTQQTTYLNFVATLAKVLRDEENFRAMMKADSEEKILEQLSGMSESLEREEEVYAKQLKTDPDLLRTRDAHADLILLARLQLNQELFETAKTGKRAIKQRIDNIRSLVEPRLLKHYDRLAKGRAPALVPVEGDTCQGCFMKLPSQYAQKVRQESDHIHTCNNCSRFIFIV